jgi:hypothetical protein
MDVCVNIRSHHRNFSLHPVVTDIYVPDYTQTHRLEVVVHRFLQVKREGYDGIGKVLPFRLSGS